MSEARAVVEMEEARREEKKQEEEEEEVASSAPLRVAAAGSSSAWKVVEPPEGEAPLTDALFDAMLLVLAPRKWMSRRLELSTLFRSIAISIAASPLALVVSVCSTVAVALLSVLAYPAFLGADLVLRGWPALSVHAHRGGKRPFPRNSAIRRDWIGAVALTTLAFGVTGVLTLLQVEQRTDRAVALSALGFVYMLNVLAFLHACDLSVENARAEAAGAEAGVPVLSRPGSQMLDPEVVPGAPVVRPGTVGAQQRHKPLSKLRSWVVFLNSLIALAAMGPGLFSISFLVLFLAAPAAALQGKADDSAAMAALVHTFGVNGPSYMLRLSLVYCNVVVFVFVAWLEFRNSLPGFSGTLASSLFFDGAPDNGPAAVAENLVLGGHWVVFFRPSLAGAIHAVYFGVIAVHAADGAITRRYLSRL